MPDGFPRRIVCLTEEPTEVLYALGEDHRIVGVSQFTKRPPQARRDKPVVSAFTSARTQRILDLQPDLVIGFSDIQADIARDLVAAGVEVWISNHRTIEGIVAYVRRLGAMVGASAAANGYADRLARHVDEVAAAGRALPLHPRVYFEEWDDPMISAITWVSELIEVAGGVDVFADKARASLAKDRVIADPHDVVDRRPDMLVASWCGKKYRPEAVYARPGWQVLEPVRRRDAVEVPAEIILQPGPAALTDGLDTLHRLIAGRAHRDGA